MQTSNAHPAERSSHWVNDRTVLILLALVFLLARLVQYQSRPFNIHPLYAMHALDIEVLQHDLLRGLYYLHSQPPLFNFILGIGLKTFPIDAFPLVFGTLYFFFGLGILTLMYGLMKELGVPKPVRISLCVLSLFYEPLLGSERYLIYTKPVSFFLILAIYAAARWFQSSSAAWFHVSLLSMTLVILLRSFFHVVVWMLPLVLYLLLLTGRSMARWPIKEASICGIYLIVAMAPYLKNLFLMGSFTTSTWFGMNLVATTSYVPPEEIDRLIREKRISPLMQIRRFSDAEVYLSHFEPQGRKPQTGVMALDAPVKTTGRPNFNCLVYVWASEEYLKSTWYLIRHYPLDYLKSVLTEIHIALTQHPGRLFTRDSIWRPAFDKAWREPLSREFLSILLLPFLLFFGYCTLTMLQVRQAWRYLQSGNGQQEDLARAAILGMSAFNLAYVLMVLALFELGEGCFMRGPIDPLIAVGAIAMISQLLRRQGST